MLAGVYIIYTRFVSRKDTWDVELMVSSYCFYFLKNISISFAFIFRYLARNHDLQRRKQGIRDEMLLRVPGKHIYFMFHPSKVKLNI